MQLSVSTLTEIPEPSISGFYHSPLKKKRGPPGTKGVSLSEEKVPSAAKEKEKGFDVHQRTSRERNRCEGVGKRAFNAFGFQ